ILSIIMIGIISFVLIMSFIHFVHEKNGNSRLKERRFSVEIFYALLIIYCIVIIGFGLIYFIISLRTKALIEYGQVDPVNILGSLIHSLYFSGVTLLTIGYGDITPVGISRLIAVVEALIGYILPAAFVLRMIQTREKPLPPRNRKHGS
ncbi:MAG TPA: ion channel, partial [Bacillota bacterium]|nr:ion channel [Bacillota bacterium]